VRYYDLFDFTVVRWAN